MAGTDLLTSAGEAVTLYAVRGARQVAGTMDDVFAGTAVDRTGQRDVAGVLCDLYEVWVERSFKGDLHGTVTVSSEQGAGALAPGTFYVLATGRVPDHRTHTVPLETRPQSFTSLNASIRSGTPGRTGRRPDGGGVLVLDCRSRGRRVRLRPEAPTTALAAGS